MKIHWYDSETTGVIASEQQMLTFAMVTTDLSLNVLDLIDKKIKLRSDVTPTKEALSVNKIDPFSLEWFSTSLDESLFCDELSKYLEKNWTEGDVFIAYSAAFDNGFMKEAFKRNKKYFYPNTVICFDPLKMAFLSPGEEVFLYIKS